MKRYTPIREVTVYSFLSRLLKQELDYAALKIVNRSAESFNVNITFVTNSINSIIGDIHS